MLLSFVDEASAAYSTGYLMGRIVGILIIVIVVLWVGKKLFGRK